MHVELWFGITRDSTMEINLLPWRDEILAFNKKRFFQLLFVALSASALVLTIIYHLFFGQLSYSQSYTAVLERAKIGLVGSVRTYFQYKKTADDVKTRLLTLRQLQRSRFDAVRLLNAITKIIPKGVYLHSLNRNQHIVDMTGFSSSNLLISSFMDAIDRSPDLDVVSLKNVQTTEGGTAVTQFDLQAKLTL